METEWDTAHITSLPSEIMCMILENNDYRDIIKLGLTCKHFNALISNNPYLWKAMLKELLPNDVFTKVEAQNYGNWFDVFKQFYKVRKQVYGEIMGMSAKYFNRIDNLKLQDARMFFSLALNDKLNYYYVIYLLQDLIRQAYQGVENNYCEKPFTLTEVYYAKAVLRYIVQTYLSVKWVQAHLKNELHPEVVLNFFMQWMDPLHFHLDDDVDNAINSLVNRVETLIPKDKYSSELTIPEKINKGYVTHKQVLHAISQIMYQEMRMAVMPHANLDTLDIIKVIHNKCGNPITLAVIYYAVAKKCGLHCELIAFPQHLILQWRNVSDSNHQVQYKIVLNTGELIPKGQCPFSNNMAPQHSAHKYCPDSLLQYTVLSYQTTKGLIKDWYTQNSTHLLNFLRTDQSDKNPYRYFLPYLLDNTQIPALNHPVHLKVMKDSHRELINALSLLNSNTSSIYRDVVVRHRNSSLKYAVGMICYHQKYEYMCVIRGWNLCCSEQQGFGDLKTSRLGSEQPFYNIVAVDQSNRYVAQEYLIEIAQPIRVYHLEDVIAKEFTHFDGFCYVPNKEKQNEYPEDGPIRDVFRTRASVRSQPLHSGLASSSVQRT